MKKYLILLLPIFILIQFSSCKTIASFDQYAYVQATSIKVDALNLMDKATSAYQSNFQQITSITTNMEKAFEYEKHRPDNEITTKMWTIIINPDGNLLGGFLSRWKASDSLNQVFIQEAKIQVAEAFDMVIELESKKIKPSDERITNFLNQ